MLKIVKKMHEEIKKEFKADEKLFLTFQLVNALFRVIVGHFGLTLK